MSAVLTEPTNRLPSSFGWFAAANYDVMDSAKILQWARAFEIRGFLQYMLGRIQRDSAEYSLADFDEVFEVATSELVVDIVSRVDRVDEKQFGHFFTKTVSPVSIGYLSAVWGDLARTPVIGRVAEDLRDGQPISESEDPEYARRIGNMPIDLIHPNKGESLLETTGGDVLALVELSAPDEVLVEHFRDFVQKYKQELGLKQVRRFSNVDFAKWRKHKLLEYMDIEVFARRHDIRLTQQQIGIALFPDEYHISLDDRIRRTVKPMAEYMLKSSTVIALLRQGDTEPG